MEQLHTEQFDDVVNSDELTLVDFSATWCMPCRMLKPILERVSEKFENVKFYNLDISQDEEIAKRYRIFSVPTMVIFKSGAVVDTLVGLNSFDDICTFISRCSQ